MEGNGEMLPLACRLVVIAEPAGPVRAPPLFFGLRNQTTNVAGGYGGLISIIAPTTGFGSLRSGNSPMYRPPMPPPHGQGSGGRRPLVMLLEDLS